MDITKRNIVIGCDNAAVDLKNVIMDFLRKKGVECENVGCDSASDDTVYPLVAARACKKIIDSGYTKRGILICGTGLGMCMSANKFRGIRAAVGHDAFSVQRSVLSNDANVLCFGARVIGPELAKMMVEQWLPLEFADGPSTPKVEAIINLEAENMK
jgi:ribose 5-phosphate isomerase B